MVSAARSSRSECASSASSTPSVITFTTVSGRVASWKRILWPTKPFGVPGSSCARRCERASERRYPTRRGCVHPTSPAAPRPSERQIFGNPAWSCPDPVSAAGGRWWSPDARPRASARDLPSRCCAMGRSSGYEGFGSLAARGGEALARAFDEKSASNAFSRSARDGARPRAWRWRRRRARRSSEVVGRDGGGEEFLVGSAGIPALFCHARAQACGTLPERHPCPLHQHVRDPRDLHHREANRRSRPIPPHAFLSISSSPDPSLRQ